MVQAGYHSLVLVVFSEQGNVCSWGLFDPWWPTIWVKGLQSCSLRPSFSTSRVDGVVVLFELVVVRIVDTVAV